MSGKKEEFLPVEPGKVKMYVCGPTVYDFLHIGNFRGPVFFNLVRNWFEKSGFEVNYVFNYTDVDDKILKRATEEGVSAHEISEKYIKEFQTDYKSLGLKAHTHNPKVTEHMQNIIRFIEELEQKELAYKAADGVYFDVKKFESYGKLSNRNIEELQAGYRIELDVNKKSSVDFALWKFSKPGEAEWESPWGKGRPGWHIECSAMSRAILGDSIDIHGGGLDLVFPHHENEIAQSEGCTGKTYVKYWMHNNMLNLGDQKMSKSLGNIKSLRSFVNEYDAEIYKFLILSAHYRSVLDFTESQINRTIMSLGKFYSALALAKSIISKGMALAPVPDSFQAALEHAEAGIKEALDDDFNTPEVMARFYEVLKVFNQTCRKPGKPNSQMGAIAESFLAWMKTQGELMSLFQQEPEEYLLSLDNRILQQKGLERKDIDTLVEQRLRARADKNFEQADQIRDQLKEMGIQVQDTLEGTTWEVDKSL